MINFTTNNLPSVGQVRTLLKEVADPKYNFGKLSLETRKNFESVRAQIFHEKQQSGGCKGKKHRVKKIIDVSKYTSCMSLEANATTLKVVPVGLIALARAYSREKKMITDTHIQQFCEALRKNVEALYHSQSASSTSSNTIPMISSIKEETLQFLPQNEEQPVKSSELLSTPCSSSNGAEAHEAPELELSDNDSPWSMELPNQEDSPSSGYSIHASIPNIGSPLTSIDGFSPSEAVFTNE